MAQILFHPHLTLPEAARLAYSQGCILTQSHGRIRMAPALPEAIRRCERSLILIDSALGRIAMRDYVRAVEDVRAATAQLVE